MRIVADGNIPFVKECFSSIGDVTAVPGREIRSKAIKDADILLVRSVTKVNAGLLRGSKVRFVGTATIGFEHVDVDYLNENDIGFAEATASNANSVAEYVVAALLSVAEKYNSELQDKSIGIIGVGNIGSKVAKYAGALGMKTLLNDPPLQRQTGQGKYRELKELYGCDFITLHVPLTFKGVDKTFHLAGGKFFDSIKAGSTFINTSRGAVTDTTALKKALNSHRLKAAVLDVWENEPNIDAELLKLADIATPHIAGYSFDGKVTGMIMIYQAACRYFGLEAQYTARNFLPPPIVPEITINKPAGNEQKVIAQAVSKVYGIKADDLRMRAILGLPVEKRVAFFDKLRKDYPIRLEFGNTRVILHSTINSLVSKFKGIGFKINNDQE